MLWSSIKDGWFEPLFFYFFTKLPGWDAIRHSIQRNQSRKIGFSWAPCWLFWLNIGEWLAVIFIIAKKKNYDKWKWKVKLLNLEKKKRL